MDNADTTREIAFVWQNQSIRDTLSLIDSSTIGGVVFLDSDGRVLGFVSDGDIRRALIRGAELSDPIREVWSAQPTSVSSRTGIAQRFQLLRERNLRHLILLDKQSRYAGLQTRQEIEDLYEINPGRCPVLLMAGGRGQRLMPLTANTPKPMLEIGGVPLLERMLRELIAQGFETFFISVNYLREKVMSHFGDGTDFNVRITYLEENEPTGTGGCLHLLPELDARHLVVMNGDIVCDLDCRSLVSFHGNQEFAATMVVREQQSHIPYGVVRVDGPRFLGLDEKPRQHYFVNAGIYALSRSALDHMPKRAFFDMPELFASLVAAGRHCGVFEHAGSWIDIGTPDQLEAAR